jgi:hypothetical protein
MVQTQSIRVRRAGYRSTLGIQAIGATKGLNGKRREIAGLNQGIEGLRCSTHANRITLDRIFQHSEIALH